MRVVGMVCDLAIDADRRNGTLHWPYPFTMHALASLHLLPNLPICLIIRLFYTKLSYIYLYFSIINLNYTVRSLLTTFSIVGLTNT